MLDTIFTELPVNYCQIQGNPFAVYERFTNTCLYKQHVSYQILKRVASRENIPHIVIAAVEA